MLGYWAVRPRVAEPPFAFETLDLAAPPIAFETRSGTVVEPGERAVVHFWATWCAPCKTELPALLAAADEEGVALFAATDEPWSVLEAYFGGNVAPAIVRDPEGRARTAFAVSGLPDTFVVERARIVVRVGGPRDWNSRGGRALLGGDAP